MSPFHAHLLNDVREDLLNRAISAAQAYQSVVVPDGQTYKGVTAEQVLQDAGLSEREQIRYMGLVCDKIRHEWGEAPDDTTRTVCYWCGRESETSTGRGIHEAGCRDKLARNRRIVHAYLFEDRPGTEIAKAEGMGWSAVYRILRQEGVMPSQRESVA